MVSIVYYTQITDNVRSSRLIIIHTNHCSKLEKLKAELNLNRHTGSGESEEYQYHHHVLQLWISEFDEAKKEVGAWEADIETLQEKIDAFQTGENVEMQFTVRSQSENVRGTEEQLVIAALQSQMDGVEINDGTGNAFEREDDCSENIDNSNIDNNAPSSDEEDSCDDNGDGRNELHFGYEIEPSNEAINMTIRDGDC